MSVDPLSPNSGGAWVTAAPTHSRPGELPPERGIELTRPPAALRGAQWGLAALILGVPLLAGLPAQMLLNRDLQMHGPAGMNLPVIFLGGMFAIILVLGLAGTGIFCGVRGWMLSVSERQPIALGLAGTLLNAVSLLIWLGIGIDLMIFFFRHMH